MTNKFCKYFNNGINEYLICVTILNMLLDQNTICLTLIAINYRADSQNQMKIMRNQTQTSRSCLFWTPTNGTPFRRQMSKEDRSWKYYSLWHWRCQSNQWFSVVTTQIPRYYLRQLFIHNHRWHNDEIWQVHWLLSTGAFDTDHSLRMQVDVEQLVISIEYGSFTNLSTTKTHNTSASKDANYPVKVYFHYNSTFEHL